MPNGHSEKQVQFKQLPVPAAGGRDGAVMAFHPATSRLIVQVNDLPAKGSLLICGAELDMTPNNAPCTTVSTTDITPVTVAGADTHLAIRFEGTWSEPVTIDAVDLTYEAADDFFSVEFPS